MVLEDDESLRKLYGYALEGLGYQVVGAASCAQAFAALQATRPDLLLMDLRIGRDLSFSVADYAALRWPDLPVLVVTGCGMFAHGELFAMARNIRCVLRKPVDLADLCNTVAHLCGPVCEAVCEATLDAQWDRPALPVRGDDRAHAKKTRDDDVA